MNVCKFSQDRKFRYRLDFELEGLAPRPERIAWILLNPSTADEQRLDPTLTRVKGYAERLGIRTVTIVNLYAWRATNPRELLLQEDPIGPDNDREIYEAVELADRIVLGWGDQNATVRRRARDVEELLERAGRLEDAEVLGTTKHGEPRHPLYMPAAAELTDYTPWALWIARGDVDVYVPGRL